MSPVSRGRKSRKAKKGKKPPARVTSSGWVEALAYEWLEGMLPGTEHSVSPGRSESFRGLISDWLDDPITDAVLALLTEWVRWNGEQAGVPASLIERAVSAAAAG
jgi:hypothetical protein